MLVYVDDIIFGGTNPNHNKAFELLMTRKFEMSMMGELKFFLGFQVRQLAKGTFISQEKYVKDMLKKFNMTNASPMKTPMPVKGQLGSCDGEKDVDIKLMFSAVFGFRNPSKEIFSELDEINAQGPIFARSFQKTEGESKWGHEVARRQGGAALSPGPSCHLLTCPFAYLKPPKTESHDTENLPESRRRIPSRDSEIASGTCRGDSSLGGVFIAMIASGVMSE
ncbi:hypothetical protein QYE76_040169 [Lolium multiflorum]|uniref:Reverse transcriptase Ty1/copia-type domain-containing protein n=1 Tax=Lolium multiflorum TaxID=4521 RepID=A0AAD8WUP5_LOLMU|nr:hypothetical protein QYE76_040169 [Lolium multiflorum]